MPDQFVRDFENSPVKLVRREHLRFDPRNPRLVDDPDAPELSQMECAELLLEDHDPISIGRSLAVKGFYPSDPVIGVVEGDEVKVVEGNRRLLALRLLLEDDLREQLDPEPEWHSLAAGLNEEAKARLAEIPTQIVEDWDEAAPIIGFRHIVGIEKWGPWEKAAFVRRLLRGREPDKAFQEASEVTSESPARLRQYLRDYLVVKQAEALGVDAQPARDSFGAFTRFLSNSDISEHLGLTRASTVATEEDQAFSADVETVRELFGLLYGTDEEPPVLTDSRRYGELGKVLASDEAREHLVRTRDLEESLALTDGVRTRVLDRLAEAERALVRAGEDIERVEIDEDIRLAIGRVTSAAEQLARQEAPLDDGDKAVPEDDFDLDEWDDDEDLGNGDDD